MTRLKRILLAILFVASPAIARQSIVIDGTGSAMTFTDPNRANTLDYRVEFQLHDFTTPGSSVYMLTMNGIGLQVYYTSGGSVQFLFVRDSYTGGSPCSISTAGRSNTVFRIQRNHADLIYYCEAWEADGTDYEYQSRAITSVNTWSSSGGSITETNLSHKIGFLRAFAERVPLNSRPPVTADTGDIIELKFEGDGADSSGNGRNLSSVASVTFEDTPGPAVISRPSSLTATTWAASMPLRAGYPATLQSNSYSMSDESADVECLWQQIPHMAGEALTSTVIFDDHTDCSPTFTGLVFGPYKFRLRASDQHGESDEADIEVGAVAYDDEGVVIYPDERLYGILGPSMAMGANPWGWPDRQHYVMAEYNWRNYKNFGGTWDAEWLYREFNGVPREGTVYTSVTQQNKVFGVGTNFLEVFCAGEVGPVDVKRYISVDLPADEGDEPKRYSRLVVSCQSDTEATFESGWIWQPAHIDSPGQPWTTMGHCSGCSLWGGRNAGYDINYYGNDLAHYSLYYRTGWLAAREAARWMTDRFAFSPWIAGGNLWNPRHAALTAPFLRATVDSATDSTNKWPRLREMVDSTSYCGGLSKSATTIGTDPREAGYCLTWLAMKALYDPDTDEATAAKDDLIEAYTNRWGSQQQPGGNYINNQAVEGDTARVHIVENGSTTVIRHSGPAYTTGYCGVLVTEAGTIAVDNTDRVTVTGTGTDLTGTAGKYMYIRGALDSEPWSMVSRILAGSTPTESSATLSFPWRGDPDSITDYTIINAIPAGRAAYSMFAGHVTSGNTLTGESDGDNFYWCRYVDDNTLSLDKPYTGDTSGGNVYRRFTWQNLTGRGSQPFIQGIIAWGLYLSADALDGYDDDVAADYRTSANALVDWIWSVGRHPVTKGMRYGVQHSNCYSPDYSPAHECWNSDPGTERSYNIELINAFSRRYLETGDPGDLTIGDALYTDTFAKDGFVSPISGDGHWSDANDEGNYTFNLSLQTKNYAQAFGVGGAQTWPAIRTASASRPGGVAPAENRTHRASFTLPAGAADAKFETINAQGVTSETICTTSPCSVSVDRRAGRVRARWTYRDGSQNTVARSDWTEWL